MKNTKVISVAIQKGGCGKTMTALNLAYSLAQKGKKVILADCDPQATASLLLNVDINDESILGMQNVLDHQMYVSAGEQKFDPEFIKKCIRRPTYTKAVKEKGKYISKEFEFGFDLIPARIGLANYDISLANYELDGVRDGGNIMKHAFDNIKNVFPETDYIIIDVLPGLNMLCYNAIAASANGGVCMVINMDKSAITGGENLLQTVTEIQHIYWDKFHIKHDGIIGILKNRYVSHLRISQNIDNDLNKYFGPAHIFKTTIPNSTKCDIAHSEGRLYAEYFKPARDAFDELADEIIEECKKNETKTEPVFIEKFGKEYFKELEAQEKGGEQ